MNKSIYLIALLLFFYSCKKEQHGPPVLPPEPTATLILESDTIYTGQFWELRIGSSPEETYEAIRQMKADRHIGPVGVVGNIFTTLQDLESRIPLYHSLVLDENPGTETGVQFAFAENKVKSIYLNSGKQLDRWPAGKASLSSVTTNDPVDVVYKKLLDISNFNEYKPKFERLSMFFKNLSTNYDSRMSVSPQWYFGSKVSEKRGYQVRLNFVNGKLFSIEYELWESQA